MATNQGFKSFVPDPKLVCAPFLYWWLRTNRPYLESLGNGATFKEVSKAVVSRIEISLPPIVDQQHIADILDRADALRAKRRATIAHLDELTQAVFVDMFGNADANAKGLKRVKLGELIKLKSGGFLPASDMDAAGVYPVLGGNGINGHHSKYMFDAPRIVIGRVGAYCGCVHLSPPKSWITDNALYVSEHSELLEQTYLLHALSHARLNRVSSQFGQPLVSGSRIYPVEILVPDLSAQRQFACRITQVLRLQGACDASRLLTDALFASLQDRAFQGGL